MKRLEMEMPRKLLTSLLALSLLFVGVACDEDEDPDTPEDAEIIVTAVDLSGTSDGAVLCSDGAELCFNIIATVLRGGLGVRDVDVRFSADDGRLESGGNPVKTDNNGNANDFLGISILELEEEAVTVTARSGIASNTVIIDQLDDNVLPNADAGADQTVDPGDTVVLDGSNSTDSDGNIISWVWDFGEGGSALEVDGGLTTHIYNEAGSFVAQLTVTDDLGGTDSDSALITVSGGNPIAAFVLSGENGEQPFEVDELITFDGSGSRAIGNNNEIVEWLWDPGDGSAQLVNNLNGIVDHRYSEAGNFTVTLTVTDDLGITATLTQAIEVEEIRNDPPAAMFVIENAAGEEIDEAEVSDVVTFDASASFDPDAQPDDQPLRFRWDPGDGTAVTEDLLQTTFTHVYTVPGTFTVQLTVIDDEGGEGVTSRSIMVQEFQNLPPEVTLLVTDAGGIEVDTINVGETLIFDGSSAVDPDDSDPLLRYQWDPGDGSGILPGDSSPIIEYVYSIGSQNGQFRISLTVIDEMDAETTVFKFIEVIDTNRVPDAVAVATPTTVVIGGDVILDGSQSSDPDNDVATEGLGIIRMTWDPGDGSLPVNVPTADTNPERGILVYRYEVAGTYIATLEVEDDEFSTAVATVVVEVTE